MIREDDERHDLIPANLRHAADHPESWDIPGLMRDAAARIEWLELANADQAGDSMKDRIDAIRQRQDFEGERIAWAKAKEFLVKSAGDEHKRAERLRDDMLKHSEAAQSLYGDIYSIVFGLIGGKIPHGCGPRQAVSLLAEELRNSREKKDDLLERSLCVIASAIVHGMPITPEIANLRNEIVETIR
jgi:hypothetical protein